MHINRRKDIELDANSASWGGTIEYLDDMLLPPVPIVISEANFEPGTQNDTYKAIITLENYSTLDNLSVELSENTAGATLSANEVLGT